MEYFRTVIVFEDESFECEDIVATEDEAREMFSERWMEMHAGHNLAHNPVRMELIRMDGPEDKSAFMATYEFHLGGVS